MTTRFCLCLLLSCGLALAEIPEGFTPLFDHQTLAGWHISLTNHHGDTSEWRIRDGVLQATQNQPGNGGILLTDEEYGDFEFYVEINPDFGCDSGIMLRSNQAGQAYQVMLDYLEGGNMGGVYGERLTGVETTLSKDWEKIWKKGGWNSMRVRMEGEAPRIQVWMNGTKVTDFRDSANHAANGRAKGAIALQVHGGTRWKTRSEFHRFRNMAVKRLD